MSRINAVAELFNHTLFFNMNFGRKVRKSSVFSSHHFVLFFLTIERQKILTSTEYITRKVYTNFGKVLHHIDLFGESWYTNGCLCLWNLLSLSLLFLYCIIYSLCKGYGQGWIFHAMECVSEPKKFLIERPSCSKSYIYWMQTRTHAYLTSNNFSIYIIFWVRTSATFLFWIWLLNWAEFKKRDFHYLYILFIYGTLRNSFLIYFISIMRHGHFLTSCFFMQHNVIEFSWGLAISSVVKLNQPNVWFILQIVKTRIWKLLILFCVFEHFAMERFLAATTIFLGFEFQ